LLIHALSFLGDESMAISSVTACVFALIAFTMAAVPEPKVTPCQLFLLQQPDGMPYLPSCAGDACAIANLGNCQVAGDSFDFHDYYGDDWTQFEFSCFCLGYDSNGNPLWTYLYDPEIPCEGKFVAKIRHRDGHLIQWVACTRVNCATDCDPYHTFGDYRPDTLVDACKCP